jgi:hypothetical protein
LPGSELVLRGFRRLGIDGPSEQCSKCECRNDRFRGGTPGVEAITALSAGSRYSFARTP